MADVREEDLVVVSCFLEIAGSVGNETGSCSKAG